jgi:hypothetical protein
MTFMQTLAFQEKLKEEEKARRERREKLLKKYLYRAPAAPKPKQEIEAYCNSLHKSHQDEGARHAAAEAAGCAISAPSPRRLEAPPLSPRRVLTEGARNTYLHSLYCSHRDVALAKEAAKVAGEEAIARVAEMARVVSKTTAMPAAPPATAKPKSSRVHRT